MIKLDNIIKRIDGDEASDVFPPCYDCVVIPRVRIYHILY